MCRNIRPLFNFEPPATGDEVRAASLQYVRKISGYTKPSAANEAAFHDAVEEIAEIFAYDAGDAAEEWWVNWGRFSATAREQPSMTNFFSGITMHHS